MAISAAEAAPAKSWRTITPSDVNSAATNLPGGCRGIYVGGAGNLAMVDGDNNVVTFTAVPVGTFMPCGAKRINATNTTATLLVALF
jgi:hypothetical protein